jgi:hypothetical protein
MWPINDVWMNVLMLAAGGCILILFAVLGSVLGQSASGRKAIKAAPVALGFLIAAYVAVALYERPSEPEKECIYAAAHPSDC